MFKYALQRFLYMLLVLLIIMLVNTSPKRKRARAANKQFTAAEIVAQASTLNQKNGKRR